MPGQRTMRIGILQTGRPPQTLIAQGMDYPELFRAYLAWPDTVFTTYPVVDGLFPSGMDVEDGWLITGSPHGVYEDHAWLEPLEAFIRHVHAARIPLVGICFGHQIIAKALGGTVRRFSGGWNIGPKTYRMDDGTDVVLNAWHQDQVLVPPPLARTFMHNSTCAYAGLAYGQHILSLQPHPEFTDSVFNTLFQAKREWLPKAIRFTVSENTLVVDPLSRACFATMIRRCFQRAQKV